MNSIANIIQQKEYINKLNSLAKERQQKIIEYNNKVRQQRLQQINQQRLQQINQQIEEPINQPIEEPINQPIEEPIEEPINQPIEEPNNQQINQPIEEPNNLPVAYIKNITNQKELQYNMSKTLLNIFIQKNFI